MTTWTDQHAANLKSLLGTTPLLARLADARPPFEGRTLEDKAMSASVVEGWESCARELAALADQATPAALPSPYIGNLEDFEARAR